MVGGPSPPTHKKQAHLSSHILTITKFILFLYMLTYSCGPIHLFTVFVFRRIKILEIKNYDFFSHEQTPKMLLMLQN